MNSDLDRVQKESAKQTVKESKSKKFDYLMQSIVIIAFGTWLVYNGIQTHSSIIGTMWFIIAFALTFIISNKLGLDDLSFFIRKPLFGAIFLLLLFASFLIHEGIKLLGLDLLRWTF